MSLGKAFAQRTRQTPSVPMREPFIAPKMLPVCCVCGLIRDGTGPSPDHERWVTQRTYQRAHGVNPIDFLHTHTYCLKCFMKAQETVKQYFRERERPHDPALRASTPLPPP